MFLAGLEGQPVDIFKFFEASDAINAQHLDALNLIATIGAFVLALGDRALDRQRLPRVKGGRRAGHDRGAARRSSGSRSHPPRHTTSTWFPTSAATSRCATSARPCSRHDASRARAGGKQRAGSLTPWPDPLPAGGGDELRRFRRLADLTAVVTFLLIVVGGVVRVSESGLGCGPGGSGTEGWPLCGGQVIPLVGDENRVIEFSHRVLATVVVDPDRAALLAGLQEPAGASAGRSAARWSPACWSWPRPASAGSRSSTASPRSWSRPIWEPRCCCSACCSG